MAIVGMVLLIACANVAVSASGLRHERRRFLCARFGRHSPRIIRQLFTESLMLAALGGSSVVLSHWGVKLL